MPNVPTASSWLDLLDNPNRGEVIENGAHVVIQLGTDSIFDFTRSDPPILEGGYSLIPEPLGHHHLVVDAGISSVFASNPVLDCLVGGHDRGGLISRIAVVPGWYLRCAIGVQLILFHATRTLEESGFLVPIVVRVSRSEVLEQTALEILRLAYVDKLTKRLELVNTAAFRDVRSDILCSCLAPFLAYWHIW